MIFQAMNREDFEGLVAVIVFALVMYVIIVIFH